jgi:hypothetical protein
MTSHLCGGQPVCRRPSPVVRRRSKPDRSCACRSQSWARPGPQESGSWYVRPEAEAGHEQLTGTSTGTSTGTPTGTSTRVEGLSCANSSRSRRLRARCRPSAALAEDDDFGRKWTRSYSFDSSLLGGAHDDARAAGHPGCESLRAWTFLSPQAASAPRSITSTE